MHTFNVCNQELFRGEGAGLQICQTASHPVHGSNEIHSCSGVFKEREGPRLVEKPREPF
jgi:hypothetical protein